MQERAFSDMPDDRNRDGRWKGLIGSHFERTPVAQNRFRTWHSHRFQMKETAFPAVRNTKNHEKRYYR
jgi:hypothetical protein